MKLEYKFLHKPNRYLIENLKFVLNIKPNLKINKFYVKNNILFLDYEWDKDIIPIINKFDSPIEMDDKIIYINFNKKSKSKDNKFFNELIEKGLVYKEMDGVYLYFGIVNELYISLSNYFRKKMRALGAEEIYLPSLLNAKTLDRTNYIKNNGLLCNYVFHKDCDVVDGVLNPAACLPLYQVLANKQKKGLFTGFSRVFRFERNNYFEMSRLREYGIRELVYVEDENKVVDYKSRLINLLIEILNELNLSGHIEIATDMFFENEFIAKSIYQKAFNKKYELRLRLNQEETIAGCSINMHNDFFTKQWGIKNGEKYYESLCLGFGIERWCYAILCQFGYDKDKFPTEIKKLIEENYG